MSGRLSVATLAVQTADLHNHLQEVDMKERTLQPALAGLCQVLADGGKIENDRRVASEA